MRRRDTGIGIPPFSDREPIWEWQRRIMNNPDMIRDDGRLIDGRIPHDWLERLAEGNIGSDR